MIGQSLAFGVLSQWDEALAPYGLNLEVSTSGSTALKEAAAAQQAANSLVACLPLRFMYLNTQFLPLPEMPPRSVGMKRCDD